jgi:hypothetical protein
MTAEPKTLGEAVCCVMADLDRLKKADRNKFASYDFTSVDDFKDAVRPLMAKYGLYEHVTQADFAFVEFEDDKGKKKQVARFDFAITLKHVAGREEPPEIMTVALPYTGAQTSGAARSYAVKEWMKSRFLASAGDLQEEADMLDQSREGLRMSKADARPMYAELEKGLQDAEKTADHEQVAKWWTDNRERIESLPKDWFLTLKNAYADAWKTLKAQADLDAMSDAELDRIAERQDDDGRANIADQPAEVQALMAG